MNVADTIHEKIVHLPLSAQEEVLEMVVEVEQRYQTITNGHPDTREIYGMWNGKGITKEEYLRLDHNERIDFDLAKEYGSDHEDE